jgi:hypothetical protein
MSELPEGRSERRVFDLKSNILSAMLGGVIGAMTIASMSRSGAVDLDASAGGLRGEVGRLTRELSDLKKQHSDLKKDIESRRGIIPLAFGASARRPE